MYISEFESMMAAADLQRQCCDLLKKLKANQASLWKGLGAPSSEVPSLNRNLQTHLMDKKPEYARQKLKSIMKNRDGDSTGSKSKDGSSLGAKEHDSRSAEAGARLCEKTPQFASEDSKAAGGKEWSGSDGIGKVKLVQGEKDEHRDSDAMQDYFESRTTNSLMEGGTNSFCAGPVSCEDNSRPQCLDKPSTPTSVRRRRIIDRHVHVDSKLSDTDLEELEKDTRGLNFSYSQNMEEEDRERMLQAENLVDDSGDKKKEVEEERMHDQDLTYQKNLVDRGNNRQLNNFIRDTTIKPKTILNSTQPLSTSYSKQNTSSNSSGASSLFRSQARERRLLGYDWIAALVSNDTGLMDESESYFQELREFRRHNRDECCNDFYMEGPFTLTDSEPPAIEKAIKDTKVQPYTVNERLFTVPLTENLLGEPLLLDSRDREEPTKDNPRFVRVSIPRSTLQMPYRVGPHRRKSFDSSDSCSLMDHCLMGWNAVSPATLPTASSVSLTDAMTGVNPKHTTTLAEAEKVAAMHHWPLLMDPSSPTLTQLRPNPLPTWRRQYLDSTLNLLPSDTSLSLSSSLDSSRQQGEAPRGQRRTDQLLNSTYAMMYHMQLAAQHRKEEERQWRQSARATS